MSVVVVVVVVVVAVAVAGGVVSLVITCTGQSQMLW